MRIVSIFCVVAVTAGTASAHIAMTSPHPRTTSQKTGPCGDGASARGTNVTTYAPGEVVTVEWDETVDHPGHFRISLDMDGEDFTNPNNPNDNFPETMVEPIADKAGGHYTQQVTMPTTLCENCTLQLMQIMTTAIPYNSFYFQCADIRISTDGGAGAPDAGAGGGGGGGDSGGCSVGSSGGGFGMIVLGVAFLLRRRRPDTEA